MAERLAARQPARVRLARALVVAYDTIPRGLLGLAIGLVLIVVLAVVVSTGELFQLSLVYLYAAAAVGLNLAMGFGGQLFLGQVAIMGVAAYTAGILNVSAGWPPFATLAPALCAGVVVGLLTGLVALRLASLYLGMVTFFMVVVLPDVVNSFPGLTGGDNGLIGITPIFALFGRTGALDYYALSAVILLIVAIGVRAVLVSGWGLRLQALRDAPEALASSAVSPTSTRIIIYGLTSLVAALAGWGLVYLNDFLSPDLFNVNLTLLLLASVAIGGQGTIAGPLIGTAIVEGYTHLVGAFSTYNLLGLGIMLMVVVLAFPRGLAEVGERALRLLRSAGGAKADRVSIAFDDLTSRHIEKTPEWLRAPRFGPADVTIANVSKSFEGVRALESVDLTVSAGSIVGLVGANGSGKTTLVNLMTGIYTPDSGEIRLADRNLSGSSQQQIARLGVTRTFQVPQFVGNATARENVEIALLQRHRQPLWYPVLRPLRSHRADRARRRAAQDVLAWLGIARRMWDEPVHNLSLGAQRVLEVGRASATGARILCLDEPAAGLNHEELEALADLLLHLRDTGRSVLLIEHNRRFVRNVVDGAVLLEAGFVTDHARVRDAEQVPGFLQTIEAEGRLSYSEVGAGR